MPGIEAEPLDLLKRSKVFRHLPPARLRAIAAAARVERYRERTLLVQRGASPEYIRYVAEGGVELIQTTSDGREAKLPPHRPGDWATWAGCLVDGPLPHDQWSAPSSVFVAFPKSIVRAEVADNPKALLEAVEIIGRSLRALMGWHFAVSLATDEQRLCQLLFHLGERSRQGGAEQSTATVTQEQIAQLGLGSRQRVARMLRKLEERGLIDMHYGYVAIRSLVRLREYGFEEQPARDG